MLKKFLYDKKGTATVEFSLTVGIFFFIVFLFFELARIALISSYLDLAVAESSRLARIDAYQHDPEKGGFDYRAAFEKRLKAGSLWDVINFGNKANKININVDYAESLDAFLNGRFTQDQSEITIQSNTNSKGKVLALYSVQYEYTKWIPIVPDFITKPIFSRRFLMVQEYERSSNKKVSK